jgi:hypothetical protein
MVGLAMRSSLRRGSAPILATLALALVSPSAFAAPPSNDARSAAQELGLPASVEGTTVEATREDSEPGSSCLSTGPSVWYRFTAAADGRIVVNLHATGDLDAVVDVFVRRRSQTEAVDCDPTDKDGEGSVALKVKRGDSYLIRVGQLTNSVAGRFTLDVFVPEAEATPPGRPLPRGGGSATLHRTLDPSDAWSVRLREGTTYRINLSTATEGCMSVALYGPGTSSFEDGSPARSVPCNGYALFTPGAGEGGRYSLLVRAARSVRTRQSYHLQVATARRDDTAPGIFVRNYQRVSGRLNARGVDVVDLYRFDVVRRSDLTLRLSGPFDAVLLTDNGRVLSSESGGLQRRVKPGRYFVAVRANKGIAGRYTLTRISRTITSTSVRIRGRRSAEASPGSAVSLSARVAPGASGPVTFVVERFDPLAGWQFLRRFHTRASGGGVSVSFLPPSVGRYRARASFAGTRVASPSDSGYARLLVAGPLRS